MLLNDVGRLLTAVQFQLSLYDGCRPVYIVIHLLHQIFGTRVRHTKKKWTQSDLSFCKNEGSTNLKLMEQGVNWIENEGKIDTKCLKSAK